MPARPAVVVAGFTPGGASSGLIDAAEVSVEFDAGRMVGDPVGSTVYLIDATAPRLYAIDTATAATRAYADLVDGSATRLLPSAVSDAHLALSHDRQHLYISLPGLKRIQKYATADLSFASEVDLAIAPTSFTVAANGYLCVSDHDGHMGMVSSFDPVTGTHLASAGACATRPLVIRGEGGSRIYAADPGNDQVFSFDVAADGALNAGPHHVAPSAYVADFSISEADQRMYMISGGVYGIDIYDMAVGSSLYASFGGVPYGRGVVQIPGGPWCGPQLTTSSSASAGSTSVAPPRTGSELARCLRNVWRWPATAGSSTAPMHAVSA